MLKFVLDNHKITKSEKVRFGFNVSMLTLATRCQKAEKRLAVT